MGIDQTSSPFSPPRTVADPLGTRSDVKPLPDGPDDRTGAKAATDTMVTPPSPPTLLDPNIHPIDLNSALQLAGVQNPQLMIARQRVVEAAALRQLAAVQIPPSIHYGVNYYTHTGPLQPSDRHIPS